MRILLLGPEVRNASLLRFLTGHGHEVFITEDPIDLEFVQREGFAFVISNGYGPILKPPLTTEFTGKIINVHPSFLPFGRGIGGNFWSFFLGSPKGVSVHLINSEIDTGDVLFQRLIEFGPKETLRTTNDILIKAAEDLFMEKWLEISDGNTAPISQKEMVGEGTYHSRRQTERLLDYLPDVWDTPVRAIEEMGADMSISAALWATMDANINPSPNASGTETAKAHHRSEPKDP